MMRGAVGPGSEQPPLWFLSSSLTKSTPRCCPVRLYCPVPRSLLLPFSWSHPHLELTLEQAGFELHGSIEMWIFFSIDHSSLGPHDSSPRCFKVTWQLGTRILGRWVMTYILYPDFELHRWPVPLTLCCSRVNKLINRYFLSIYFTSFFFLALYHVILFWINKFSYISNCVGDLIIQGLFQEEWKSFYIMYSFIKPIFNDYLLGVRYWATKMSPSFQSPRWQRNQQWKQL